MKKIMYILTFLFCIMSMENINAAKTNYVCTKIADLTLKVGYMSEYSISTQVIGAATCNVTINYRESKGDEMKSEEFIGIDNIEHCKMPENYQISYKSKVGDYLHPTGYLWELQYCALQKSESQLKENFNTANKVVYCNNIEIPYGLPYIVYRVINLIKILTPIILIVLGSIDFAKAVMAGNEEEMKKSQARFIKRVIAGIIVFFVIAIVQFVFNILGNNDTFSCFSCFVSGDDCNVVDAVKK